jgi:hypothetical protein
MGHIPHVCTAARSGGNSKESSLQHQWHAGMARLAALMHVQQQLAAMAARQPDWVEFESRTYVRVYMYSSAGSRAYGPAGGAPSSL